MAMAIFLQAVALLELEIVALVVGLDPAVALRSVRAHDAGVARCTAVAARFVTGGAS